MSASPERRDPIDIEEFERRLRAPESLDSDNDPMADLARLVAGQGRPPRDPFAAIFNEGAHRAPPIAPQPQAPHLDEGFHSFADDADFPDLRPMLRPGEFPRLADPGAPSVEAPEPDDFHASSEYEDWATEDSVPPGASAMPNNPRARSKKPLYLTAAIIVAGFGLIATSLAWRGGAGNPSGIAIIKAASGPTKVQPQGVDAVDSSDNSTLLDKSAGPQVKKVVSRDEPPMDVNAAEKSPRVIPLSDSGPSAMAVPAPPPLRAQDQPQQPASVFPEPKRVKTVAVRADGSIISSESAPAPAPPPRPAPTPARNATPKTDQRAAATPSDSTKPAAVRPQPRTVAPVRPAPKPKQTAAVQPQDDTQADDGAPADAPAKPVISSGSFAVQLGVAGSEAEARQLAQRLGEKYSGQIGGRRPSVQKAADKALYRVRVGGLSREAAVSDCEQIKSAGGACFVAH